METHPDISLLKYFPPFKILSDRRCLVSQAGKPILKIAEKDEGGTRSQVKVRELRNILIQNIFFFSSFITNINIVMIMEYRMGSLWLWTLL